MVSYSKTTYQQALTEKVQVNSDLFAASLQHITPQIYPSPYCYYRNRVEFRIWHTQNKCQYALTDPATKKLEFIKQFEAATKNINICMSLLLDLINQLECIKKSLFAIEFCESTNGTILVTLIYHKRLDAVWLSMATALEAQIQQLTKLTIHIIGRSKKQLEIVSKNYFINSVTLAGKTTHYKHIENTFMQPNLTVNQKMLEWLYQNTANTNGSKHKHDVLELYCGSGNFTLQLARNFRRVLANEVNKLSCKSLQWNCETNKIDNIELLRMHAHELVQCLNRVRPFYRARHLNLDDYQFKTVFVDPPRAGIDSETLAYIAKYSKIIYISCNPKTMIDNIKDLGSKFEITKLAFFDQFPYTPHLEVGAVIEVNG